jgi:Flp pilus assembly protein TadD
MFADGADDESAIREYQRALDGGGRSIPGDEAYILKSLALALKHAGRREEAVQAILRSLELNPDDSDAMFSCANLKRELGDSAGAEYLAARAVQAQPAHGPALALLGCLRAERGDADGALPLLRRAAATDPDEPATQLYIAHAYAQLGRTQEACALFRRARQLDLVPAVREQVERMISATCR